MQPLPLPLSDNLRYSLPNKLFNSMAAGACIVATDMPDLRAIVEKYEAGVVVLPNRTVRASATSSLYVSMASSSAVAGHAVELDYVCFVPLSCGNLMWHHAVATSHCNRLYLDDTGTLYVDDAVNPQYATGSAPLKARTGRLVIAAEDPSGATAGQTMNVTVAYYPRYSLWR